jgi:hypothetical protein
MTSRSVALVRTEVSKERSASFIRVTRIGVRTTIGVTSNRRTLRRNTVRKEAGMEFRISDAEGLGEVVAWGCKWPEYKARSQASVEGSSGIVCKHVMNAEPRRQVSLGHVPKVLWSR